MIKKKLNEIDSSYPGFWQSSWLLFVLFIAYTLSFIDRQILTLLVDPIQKSIGLSDFEISLLHGFAFAIFFSIAGLPLGRLADHSNRRVIIGTGIATWSLMTALCGLTKSFSHLFVARMCVGIGEASLMPSAYSMLSDAFPPKKLNTAIAIFSMGGTLGTGLALIGGGALITFVSTMDILNLKAVFGFESWQVCFLLVGLPGLLVALAMCLVIEPSRKGVIRDSQAQYLVYTVREVIDYLWIKRSSYGALFFATAFMTALSAGFLMWYPNLLIRAHGYTIIETGYTFGLIFLVFGSSGALSGGLLASELTKRGILDANMRVIAVAATMSFPAYLIAPQIPATTLSLLVIGLAIFFTQMIAGVCVAAIQLITPNQMRGQASAVFLLAVNCIGFGIGPTLVAIFNDFIFNTENPLSLSLSSAALLIGPVCITWYWQSLPAYRSQYLTNVDLTGKET